MLCMYDLVNLIYFLRYEEFLQIISLEDVHRNQFNKYVFLCYDLKPKH